MDKTIVLTLYGTGEVINDFTITLFDENSYNFGKKSVHAYCSNINELELKDDRWVYASIVKENQKTKLVKPGHTDFDILGTLDDRAIQRVIAEVDSNILAQALKTAKKETLKAVLRNMSKRAAKMLIEGMEYMGPILLRDVKEARKKVVEVIQRLESWGVIIVPKSSQDVV